MPPADFTPGQRPSLQLRPRACWQLWPPPLRYVVVPQRSHRLSRQNTIRQPDIVAPCAAASAVTCRLRGRQQNKGAPRPPACQPSSAALSRD